MARKQVWRNYYVISIMMLAVNSRVFEKFQIYEYWYAFFVG